MIKREKCYTYLRVSTEKQVDGYSIDAQRKNVQKLADLKNFDIVQEYVDAGFSGADVQNRPAFTQMMKDIENDKDGIRYVLSFKLSRLGRNAIDTLDSLRKMQEHGVDILTDDGAVDSASAYGNFFILIMSGLAEMERENILMQTFAGRVEKARQGRYNGGQAPYGYRIKSTEGKNEKGVLEINEEEAPLIRLIFDRYVYHEKGDGKVAEYLATHGYYKNIRENGKLAFIDESFVGKVIRNEVYCGEMVYGKRKNVKNPKTGKISTHLRDESEWYRSEGLHDAIISKELFNKAQAIRKKNTHNQPKVFDPNHAAVFSGILVCPECGSPMHGVGGMGKVKLDGKHGGGQYYYSCSNHRRRRGEYRCPYSRGWRRDRIDAEMSIIISQIFKSNQLYQELMDKPDDIAETYGVEEQLENISKQISNKTMTLKRRQMAIDNFDWNADNADELYQVMYEDYLRLQNEILALQKDQEETRRKSENLPEGESAHDDIAIPKLFGIYDYLSEVQKKDVANALFKRIEIFREEQEDGAVIKSVSFQFPLTIGATTSDEWLMKDFSF